MAAVEYPAHLIDNHIRRCASELVEQIQSKSRDIDGVELSYEDATAVANQVIKEVKK